MSSFRRTFTVRRRATGDYNATTGIFEVSAPETEIEIEASLQPVSGSDIALLPENRREEELLKIYTDTLLIGAEKGSTSNCDIVEINGVDYEVVKVFPWQNSVISHYEIMLAKRTTNDAVPVEEEAP